MTLAHGPIPSMQWGPMIMPFQLPRADMAKDLKSATSVRFRFRAGRRDFRYRQHRDSSGGAR